MISDFIELKMIMRSPEGAEYQCNLPDPDIEHEECMVLCGHVRIYWDSDRANATIKIELLDNFRELCIGDIYQRKQFVSTILDIIGRDICFEQNASRIILHDFAGSFTGVLHEL